MKIIALSAKAGCGKTTITDYIREMLQCSSVRVSFGDPVKQECSRIYGFPLELCYSEAGKKTTVFIGEEGVRFLGESVLTVREVMQRHGMLRREENPLYWVNKVRDFFKQARISRISYVINDDCRMPNEADLIREFGGKLYRIQPYPGWKPGKHATHISETALDDWPDFDQVFCPEKGMECLKRVAEEIVAANSEL